MTQPESKQVEPLVPASMRPSYDPAQDMILQAIRKEVLDLLEKPLDGRSLGIAQTLLHHAAEILQIRKGKVKLKGKGARFTNSGFVTIGSDDDYGVDDDEPLAQAPRAETFGTHATRSISAALNEGLGLLGKHVENSSRESPHARMLAAESTVRALSVASSLPDEMRDGVVDKLLGEFDGIMMSRTLDAQRFEEAPSLVAHDHRSHSEPASPASVPEAAQ